MVDLPGGLLGTTAIVTVAFQLLFFGIASFFQFDKVTDLAGGSNFILLAALTFSLGAATFAVVSQQQIALTTLVIVWGIRLSAFLFYRIMLTEEDHRFDGIRDNPCKFLVFWVIQMLWVWVVSLPLTFINSTQSNREDGALVASDIAGIVLAIGGFVIEAIADQTKFSFKQNPSNNGKWCADGIWSWSRHPNYFGEVSFWWGIFLGASSQFVGANAYGYFTIVSPLFVMALLFGLSGLPLLESGLSRKYGTSPGFREYHQRTSIFVPMPPFVYRSMPSTVKGTRRLVVYFVVPWKRCRTPPRSCEPFPPFSHPPTHIHSPTHRTHHTLPHNHADTPTTSHQHCFSVSGMETAPARQTRPASTLTRRHPVGRALAVALTAAGPLWVAAWLVRVWVSASLTRPPLCGTSRRKGSEGREGRPPPVEGRG